MQAPTPGYTGSMGSRVLLVLALLVAAGLAWMARLSLSERSPRGPSLQAAAEPEPTRSEPAAAQRVASRAPVVVSEAFVADVTWPPEVLELLEQRYAGRTPVELQARLDVCVGEQATELSRIIAERDAHEDFEEELLRAGALDSARTQREGPSGREHLGFSMVTPRTDGSRIVSRYWIDEANCPRWTELEREVQWLTRQIRTLVRSTTDK